jgi:hypothetical protein
MPHQRLFSEQFPPGSAQYPNLKKSAGRFNNVKHSHITPENAAHAPITAT